jgi:uncharacterized iron-regulated membrane protein
MTMTSKLSRSGRFRIWVRRTHRWAAFVLFAFIVIEFTSGAFLLFDGEYFHLKHPSLFRTTPSAHPLSIDAAVKATEKATGTKVGSAYLVGGVYVLTPAYGPGYDTSGWPFNEAFVDPGSGRLLGTLTPAKDLLDSYMRQAHDFAFASPDLPGGFASSFGFNTYLHSLDNWLPIGWWSLWMNVIGVAAILFAATGIYLWWPWLHRFFKAFRIRGGSTLRVNYDIHKIVGIIAVPFFLMWALTAMGPVGYSLPIVEKAWDTVTRATELPQPPDSALASTPLKSRPISPGQVVAAAQAAVPGASFFSVIFPPTKADVYQVTLKQGSDPARRATTVYVDQFSGKVTWSSAQAWKHMGFGAYVWNWGWPLHIGTAQLGVGLPGMQQEGLPARILLGVVGLIPLVLTVTGLLIWWLRRRLRLNGSAIGRRDAAV